MATVSSKNYREFIEEKEREEQEGEGEGKERSAK